ncbi:TPA: integrase [Candidatus Uhrbacteria bacterium]|nr:integrase [Candidatus Uhrbacteria bacterium]
MYVLMKRLKNSRTWQNKARFSASYVARKIQLSVIAIKTSPPYSSLKGLRSNILSNPSMYTQNTHTEAFLTFYTRDNLIHKAREVFDGLDVSEGTRKDYQSRIGMFLYFLEKNGFDHNSYLSFKRLLAARTDLSVATKNKYLSTSKVFLRELVRTGLIPVDITANVRLFSQSKKHKKQGFCFEEIETIAEALKQMPETDRTKRLRALFCLLAFQGLRQIEIIRLSVQDLDFASDTAMIQGKGSDDKERVYLSPETVQAIKVYMKATTRRSGALFQSFGNRKGEHLSTRTIQREFETLLKDLRITRTVHGFRHFYITTLLQNFDVRDARKFSRHKNLETLIIYDDETEISHKCQDVFSCFDGVHVA